MRGRWGSCPGKRFAFPVFQAPRVPRNWAGYELMAIGLLGTLVSLRRFSAATVIGLADALVTDGAYHWSRNPQYDAYTLFIA